MEITRYCKVCGKRLDPKDAVCSRCSSPTGYDPAQENSHAANNANAAADQANALNRDRAADLPTKPLAEKISDGMDGENDEKETKWAKRGSALLWTAVVIVVLLAAAFAAIYLGTDGDFEALTRLFTK